jgi:hypothetical protein
MVALLSQQSSQRIGCMYRIVLGSSGLNKLLAGAQGSVPKQDRATIVARSYSEHPIDQMQ